MTTCYICGTELDSYSKCTACYDAKGAECDHLRARNAELEAEVARLRKAQVVTINPPPMPESEVIGYLKDFNKQLQHEVNRLREYIMKLEANDG
jgi:hypothetical protein